MPFSCFGIGFYKILSEAKVYWFYHRILLRLNFVLDSRIPQTPNDYSRINNLKKKKNIFREHLRRPTIVFE